MISCIIIFPGTNCERETRRALEKASGRAPLCVDHHRTDLPICDLIVLPGGFAFGDYLRAGAIAARTPVISAVITAAKRGVFVLGICNGFQILTECGLLPGAIARNHVPRFLSKQLSIRVARADTAFTCHYHSGQIVQLPIAHQAGRYVTDTNTYARLEGEGQIAFRYAYPEEASSNGSLGQIAGLFDQQARVLGVMPHPERAAEKLQGSLDGIPLFSSLVASLAAA